MLITPSDNTRNRNTGGTPTSWVRGLSGLEAWILAAEKQSFAVHESIIKLQGPDPAPDSIRHLMFARTRYIKKGPYWRPLGVLLAAGCQRSRSGVHEAQP